VDEGTFITLAPATFTDPGVDNALGGTSEDFTATITWGDGTSEPAADITLVKVPGSEGVLTTGTVQASHAYADDGIYTVTVTVTDDNGGSGEDTFLVTVNNLAPTLDAGGDQTVDEGTFITLAPATFTDPGVDNALGGTSEDFTATITWGDGTTEPAADITLVEVSGSEGVLTTGTVQAQHTYADDGIYAVTLTVSDDDGGTKSDTLTVTVNNVAPQLTLDPVAAINEDGVATLTGTITDPGTLDTFTLDVNWDDPLSPNDIEQYTFGASATGSQTFSLTHQYLDDNPSETLSDDYTIGLTITDDDTGSTGDSTIITVNNVAPVLSDIVTTAIDENGVTTLTGTIIDPGTLDTFTLVVNWGDPLSPDNEETYAYAAGTTSFELTHQYLDDNPTGTAFDTYTISATVTDDDMGTGTDSMTVTVNNVAPQLTLDPVAAINENGVAILTGTISDPGTLDTFTLDVNWGDPLSPNDIEQYTFGASSAQTQSFTLTHRYLDDNPTMTPSDSYTINLTVTDDDTGTGTASVTLQVDNVSPVVDPIVGPVEGVRGQPLSYVGTFSDVGTLDTHTLEWTVTFTGPPEPCMVCMYAQFGKPLEMTFKYTGGGEDATNTAQPKCKYEVSGDPEEAAKVHIIASSKHKLKYVDESNIFFEGDVNLGEAFTLKVDKATKKSRFESKTYIFIMDMDGNVIQTVQYHTSGSAPIVLGDVIGGLTLTGYVGEGGSATLPEDPTIYSTGTGSNFTFTPTQMGTYTIKFTVTDDDTGQDSTTVDVEITRTLFKEGTLYIGGTNCRDHIDVEKGRESGTVKVKIHEKGTNFKLQETYGPKVDRVVVYAQAGDDHVKVHSNLGQMPTEFYGGDGDDHLKGGKGDDKLDGGPGDDYIDGHEGNNVLLGGEGNDRIKGGSGDDELDGGNGDDRLYGGRGDDYLLGGEGDDRLYGGPGDDILEGGDGNDVLKGGSGDDLIDGGSGHDKLYGNTHDDDDCDGYDDGGDDHHHDDHRGGRDVILGGDGDDWIFGGSGNDLMEGGAGDDWLFGSRGNDQISGGEGNDWIVGGSGNDELDGGNGDDSLCGGNGDDYLLGGSGDDRLYGGPGDDILEGGDGNDELYGDQGDDRIWGGNGNDLLVGGHGDDNLDGGEGDDTLIDCSGRHKHCWKKFYYPKEPRACCGKRGHGH